MGKGLFSIDASFCRQFTGSLNCILCSQIKPIRKNAFYCIKTSEIPVELSRKTDKCSHVKLMLASHVKWSPLLWLHTKWRLPQRNWNVLAFHWYLNKIRTLHTSYWPSSRAALEVTDRVFSLSIWGAGMAPCWERSLPTNVAWVQFRPGVICELSLLLVRVLAPSSNSTRIEDPHENQLRLLWLPL